MQGYDNYNYIRRRWRGWRRILATNWFLAYFVHWKPARKPKGQGVWGWPPRINLFFTGLLKLL
jgi:hypothetical protein